jgi:curli production assembly/transport component CsgF
LGACRIDAGHARFDSSPPGRRRTLRLHHLAAALYFTLTAPAMADMVYRPINPSFGGDPFNSNHLTSLANSQNLHRERQDAEIESASGRFLAMLESQLYSSLASQVSEAIFGENAQKTGTITFNDQQVRFINTGTEIRITVTDFLTGKVTNITVPTLVTK